jgi:hypothetical protein
VGGWLVVIGAIGAVHIVTTSPDLRSFFEFSIGYFLMSIGAFVLGGILVLDTLSKERAVNEKPQAFQRTSPETAEKYKKMAHKIVDRMPNFNGDFESLPGSGWVHIPQNFSVTCERGLPQWWGGVQLYVTVAFDPRSGAQWGPEYHLAPAVSGPSAYGIDLDDWADPRAFDMGQEDEQ